MQDKNKSLPDPTRLLDAVIEKLRLKNDRALCRVLGVAPPVISKIRHRRIPVGAGLLIRMHEESGMSIRELKSLFEPQSAVIIDIARAPNGCRYARSKDINAVRDELRRNGFECERAGWIRRSDGAVSALDFHQGEWSAAIDRLPAERKTA